MLSRTVLDKIVADDVIDAAAATIAEISDNASNEEQLKINVESVLKRLCELSEIPWNPYTYEHSFRFGKYRLDAVHGSTVIEYEPPRSFCGTENAQLRHARKQAEDYVGLLSCEEGRRNGRYSLVVWDGKTISFGSIDGGRFFWDDVEAFGPRQLYKLLRLIAEGGKPLVSPFELKRLIGPDTLVGKDLIPAFYNAIIKSVQAERSTRTKLIYTEWARLFGQVDGVSSEQLKAYLKDVSRTHGVDYFLEPQAYVFALNTYIALVAKICAVYALSSDGRPTIGTGLSVRTFLSGLERGDYFSSKGIQNMLSTDFFSWYLGDDVEDISDDRLGRLVDQLALLDFDITQKSPESVRDLFKGLYMEFMPKPMRHALGEYYTPDWLASHVIDVSGWGIDDSLLDPTCGSGTFILEVVKRRLELAHPMNTANEILEGLYGFDLNPLAVLTARASLVVFLAAHFKEDERVVLPIYLADAINTADPVGGVFTHSILTEKGERTFSVPEEIAASPDFYDVMNHLRICIDAGLDSPVIYSSLEELSPPIRLLDESMSALFKDTIDNLVDLHRNHWNGIWCLILFDRIKAGCVANVDYVVGNPPWVKWSNLPRQYAQFIKPICERMDIFSEDSWVGGIQSDVSTVVTYHALERFVRRGGKLAFLITGTVFKNESSQGFRRWKLADGDREPENMTVEVVEDYKALRPFEHVANWPTLLVLSRNGSSTEYPVPYLRYERSSDGEIVSTALNAMPVPGSVDGPWLVGGANELPVWEKLFDVNHVPSYTARKGITTDANGIFFVKARGCSAPNLVKISNDPNNGRRAVQRLTSTVEDANVFPLLRGRGISRFGAALSEEDCVLVPQRGMFGDEELPVTSPRLFEFLSAFRDELLRRSSYKRFQQGKPFWSIWTTGEYTFAPYKVVWKEMSGSGFVASYVGSHTIANGAIKPVVPDHKVYFIPLDDEDEAAYLTAFLNAGIVSHAISAYASALSLGTSVVEYLKIPKYSTESVAMRKLATLGKRLNEGARPGPEDERQLDGLVCELMGISSC